MTSKANSIILWTFLSLLVLITLIAGFRSRDPFNSDYADSVIHALQDNPDHMPDLIDRSKYQDFGTYSKPVDDRQVKLPGRSTNEPTMPSWITILGINVDSWSEKLKSKDLSLDETLSILHEANEGLSMLESGINSNIYPDECKEIRERIRENVFHCAIANHYDDFCHLNFLTEDEGHQAGIIAVTYDETSDEPSIHLSTSITVSVDESFHAGLLKVNDNADEIISCLVDTNGSQANCTVMDSYFSSENFEYLQEITALFEFDEIQCARKIILIHDVPNLGKINMQEAENPSLNSDE